VCTEVEPHDQIFLDDALAVDELVLANHRRRQGPRRQIRPPLPVACETDTVGPFASTDELAHLAKVHSRLPRQIPIEHTARLPLVLLPPCDAQVRLCPFRIPRRASAVDIGQVTQRSRMNDVSPWITPCVRGVLIEDDVPALGVWRIVERGLGLKDGPFEALLNDRLE